MEIYAALIYAALIVQNNVLLSTLADFSGK